MFSVSVLVSVPKSYCFMSVLSVFCNKTKWFSCLHLVVLFLFAVIFSMFVFRFFFSFLSKKRTQQKTQKTKYAEKKGYYFSARVVVFTNGGWVLKIHCAENTIKTKMAQKC